MAPFDSWSKIEEEDEEELEDESFWTGHQDAVLFAIDCSESMLELRDDGRGNQRSHLHIALEGCKDLQRRKAVVGPNDSVGIMVFNTVQKAEAREGDIGEIKDNCYAYQPVERINAPKIQELGELLDEALHDPNSLRKVFTPKKGGRVPMGDVFTSCNWMLRDGAPQTAAKRLFLITDEDNPHPGNPQLLKTATNTLFDLKQLGVVIQTFFISPHDKPFKYHKFWATVLGEGNEDMEIVEDAVTSFDNLLAEMRFREAPKRSVWSIPFHLGEKFTIGVKGYGLVTEQKKTVYSYRSNVGREQEEVKSRTAYVDEELEMERNPTKIVYGMSLGLQRADEEEGGLTRTVKAGTKVFYNADEVRQFRTLGLEPGIKLLGFKDLDQLTIEDSVKHSFFIYPDESAYEGSTRTFSALLRTMVEKQKMGLVLGLFRRNSSPAFYAMIGQMGEADGSDPKPDGFHLIQLPFADDIREARFDEACQAEEKTVEAAAAWIEKLKIKNGNYNADDNPNPALQMFYAQVEALAFNEEFDPASVEDYTLPPTEVMKKRAGGLIAAWKEAVNEDGSSHKWFMKGSGGGKRKVEEGGQGMGEEEVRGRYEAGTLSKLTVAQMKASDGRTELFRMLMEWIGVSEEQEPDDEWEQRGAEPADWRVAGQSLKTRKGEEEDRREAGQVRSPRKAGLIAMDPGIVWYGKLVENLE